MALVERIPIHPSFAARELVNRPENLKDDIHEATKPPAIALIHSVYLTYLSLFSLSFCLSLTLAQSNLSHHQSCISYHTFCSDFKI